MIGLQARVHVIPVASPAMRQVCRCEFFIRLVVVIHFFLTHSGSVVQINLSNNNVKGTLIDNFYVWYALSNLEVLIASQNDGLTGRLPNYLWSAQKIRVLDMSDTLIGGSLQTFDDVGDLLDDVLFWRQKQLTPVNLCYLQNLQEFHFHNTNLASTIPDCLCLLPKLKVLHLIHNYD